MRTHLSKLAFGLALLSPMLGFSQEQKIQPCNTFAAMEEYFNANPQKKIEYEKAQTIMQKEYEDFMASLSNNSNAAAKTTATFALVDYTIPVVFHILHQYGAENINDQICIDAVAQMNRDYARQGSDTNQIFLPFRDGTYTNTPAGYIDSHIKFMLAHKDPSGNVTSGIIHYYDTRTDWDQSNTNYYNGLVWTPSKYLNIIIVRQIIPPGGSSGGGVVVGYTHIPPVSASIDAIVYRYDYISGLGARSLSHEGGHWLGLTHTFGNTNNPGVVCGSTNGGDGIADTPDTKGNFSTCPNSASGNVCVTSAYVNTVNTITGVTPGTTAQVTYYGAGQQNVENFMDYSSCPKNFTTGQTLKMQSVLASGASGRNNLSSSTNLTATDVNGTAVPVLVADWASANLSYTVCSGSSLNMKDYSYNGMPASWSWAANNGATAASPTSSVTNITFPTAGIATVTLTVTNSNNVLSSKTRTVLVVDATPGSAVPLMESFESGLPANWSVVNPNAGSAEWALMNDAGYDGTASYFIEGINAAANQQDYLYLPIINMQSNPDKTFTFAYAYARPASTHTDVLRVQASTDCGGTWADLTTLTAQQMANNTGGIISDNSPYYPQPWEWYVQTVSGPSWNQYKNAATLLIRFNFIEASSGHGNNLFIDAINLGGTVGLSELAKSLSLNLYPNPTNGETVLEFNLSDASSIKVNVLDVTGRVVLNVANTNFAPGEHSISINESSTLERGVYFVNMTVNGKSLTRKLLID